MWCVPGAAVPIVFVVFVLLLIPLCYWFVGMMKKRRAKKEKVVRLRVSPVTSLQLRSYCDGASDLHPRQPWRTCAGSFR